LLTLTDLTGRIVFNKKIGSGEWLEFAEGALSAGTYLILLADYPEAGIRKLIVNRGN
jgi:hypothetical protein